MSQKKDLYSTTFIRMRKAKNMLLELKKSSRRTIKACLGPKYTAWARNIYDRWLINRFHNLIKTPFDVIFLCWPEFWPNIQPVVKVLIGRRDDLRVDLVFCCWKEELPDAVYLIDVP